MALVLADRVRETTTVTGTGTATLLGAAPGYQSFSAVGNANTTYYVIANQSATEWEVGIGTYTASGTLLSRDTVLSSSNSGSLVNFSAGTKDVFVDYPAGRAVYEDAAGNVDGYPITGGTINNTTIGATTPSTGVFTTLTATGNTTLGSGSVNWVQIVGSGSGGSPYLYATGGSSAGLDFYTNSSLGFKFRTNNGTNEQARVSHTASAVNYVQVTGGATTKGVIQSAQGSDSNISYVTQSKGTGAIDLAAGSSGVNISNGGTVTAITRTASGSSYTSAPALAITAPTTAGGVQATATCTIGASSATVVSGGTGYTLNDVITISGGTFGVAAVGNASAVSGGVVTAITITGFGSYTAFPSSPASTTGGTGTGLTVTLGGGFINTAFTITNAGSGYVEQPTVTFSGGGGSGAAAFATVGSQSIIKGIGTSSGTISNQSIMFQTPSGNSLLLRDPNQATPDAHLMMQATASGYGILVAEGSNANASLFVGAKGSGSVRFSTSGTTLTEQARVAHTASAVNYVQVTGAATGNRPVISAQGSDTSIALDLQAKGTSGYVNIDSFRANYLRVQGSSTNGGIATLSTQGVDTNIDLTLTPKGTGNVRFGTYTGTILTPTGYVEIKDSGGTVRRLLVG